MTQRREKATRAADTAPPTSTGYLQVEHHVQRMAGSVLRVTFPAASGRLNAGTPNGLDYHRSSGTGSGVSTSVLSHSLSAESQNETRPSGQKLL